MGHFEITRKLEVGNCKIDVHYGAVIIVGIDYRVDCPLKNLIDFKVLQLQSIKLSHRFLYYNRCNILHISSLRGRQKAAKFVLILKQSVLDTIQNQNIYFS